MTDKEVCRVFARQGKFHAVKFVIAETGMEIREALKYVEQFEWKERVRWTLLEILDMLEELPPSSLMNPEQLRDFFEEKGKVKHKEKLRKRRDEANNDFKKYFPFD